MPSNAPSAPTEPTAWINGEFVAARQAWISPFDRGFLFGDGLFETMRAEHGEVLHLGLHLDRLAASLRTLRIEVDLGLEWRSILEEVLRRGGLADGTAAVKLIVTRGVAAEPGLPVATEPTLLATARPYREPDYERGWRLHVVRDGYSPPLAAHKSLNYLYCLFARQVALDADADEAVILDSRGQVAETAAGSLLARLDGRWVRPDSPYRLAGTTIELVARYLAEAGEPAVPQSVAVDELLRAETVWVLNSLLGVMPVVTIDGHRPAEPRFEMAEGIRARLFER